ncbi:hypothetical protein ACH6CV_12570 [Bacillota bacterium Meth-B3]
MTNQTKEEIAKAISKFFLEQVSSYGEKIRSLLDEYKDQETLLRDAFREVISWCDDEVRNNSSLSHQQKVDLKMRKIQLIKELNHQLGKLKFIRWFGNMALMAGIALLVYGVYTLLNNSSSDNANISDDTDNHLNLPQ